MRKLIVGSRACSSCAFAESRRAWGGATKTVVKVTLKEFKVIAVRRERPARHGRVLRPQHGQARPRAGRTEDEPGAGEAPGEGRRRRSRSAVLGKISVKAGKFRRADPAAEGRQVRPDLQRRGPLPGGPADRLRGQVGAPRRTIVRDMRRYAVAGTPTSAELGEIVRAVAKEFERDGFVAVDERRRRRLRPQHVRRGDAEGVPAQGRAGPTRPPSTSSTRRPRTCSRRATRCSCGRSRTSSSSMSRGRARGSRPWSRGTYKVSEDPHEIYERLAPLAKSKLVIDNEFRPDLEPELWDGDEITRERRRGGQAARRARPAARAVPRARVPLRARPAPRDAALPGRRPLLRQPLRAQGRDALLDERQRRRQVAARDRRRATSCSSSATTSRMRASSSACRPASSRAACRSTRSSTG